MTAWCQVVFRGFYKYRNPANKGELLPTSTLQFITDMRSEKIGQVLAHSYKLRSCKLEQILIPFLSNLQIGKNEAAEACWYFLDTREQFRISGTLQVIAAAEAAQVRIKG